MEYYIDFNSDEAIYIQLCNQIIYGIATNQLSEGDSLPSVRSLADEININMHTVNKAYGILREEGYVKLDRRRGAIISIDRDKSAILEAMKDRIMATVARGICSGVTREEAHAIIDDLYDRLTGQ